MKLIKISESHVRNILLVHDRDGGNLVNASLSKLFECMNDESSRHEVSIKVAALNQIYATAIQYITPVVDEIIHKVPENHKVFSDEEYSKLVDEIATVSWISPTTGKRHSRCNLSFASKYIHFLSRRRIPIYDSYIWIVMIGYFKQNGCNTYSFSTPKSYKDFYEIFIKFKQFFDLKAYPNYEIDKFLWQYGKNMLNDIIKETKSSLDSAKTTLKKRITNYSGKFNKVGG